MEAGTGVTTSLEQHVEEPELVVPTQSPTEVLSEAAEEGCEPSENDLNSFSDDGNLYDDTELYGSSGEEIEGDYDDGDNWDEEFASDDTQAYDYSYENDEAVGYEGQDETSWNINEDDGAAGFRNSSDYYSCESEENEHASRKIGLEISDAGWDTPYRGPKPTYV